MNSAGICGTVKMGAGKSSGKHGMSSASASGPPVDAPTTTTSTRRTSSIPLDGVSESREGDAAGKLEAEKPLLRDEYIRIFGSRSSRMTFKASEGANDSAGFKT